MNRRVERSFIDKWLEENGPDALLRLADRSGVSSSTITKARLGVVPKRKRTRLQLCKALRVGEDALFPLSTMGGVAS